MTWQWSGIESIDRWVNPSACLHILLPAGLVLSLEGGKQGGRMGAVVCVLELTVPHLPQVYRATSPPFRRPHPSLVALSPLLYLTRLIGDWLIGPRRSFLFVCMCMCVSVWVLVTVVKSGLALTTPRQDRTCMAFDLWPSWYIHLWCGDGTLVELNWSTVQLLASSLCL